MSFEVVETKAIEVVDIKVEELLAVDSILYESRKPILQRECVVCIQVMFNFLMNTKLAKGR